MHYSKLGALPIALAALLGQSIASPIAATSSVSARSLFARQHNSIDDQKEWCSGSGSGIKDWDTAKDIYLRVKLPSAVEAVIKFLSPNGEEGWLRASEETLFGDGFGNEGSAGCSDLTTGCQPGRDEWQCSEYFEHEPDKIEWKYAYWAFRGMRGIHNKLNMMTSEILYTTVVNGLHMKDIVSDLEADPEKDAGFANEMMTWMSSAFLVAGSVAALGNPVVGTAGVVLGLALVRLADDAEPDEDETVKLGDIEKWLGDHFDNVRKTMQSNLRLASGVKQDGDRFDSLPSLTYKTLDEDFDTESHVSRFFATPFWLLDVDSQMVRDAVNSGGDNIRYRLIDIVLQSVGWTVMGDDEIKDQETCNDTRGGRWMEVDGTHYCLSLWWKNELGTYQQSNHDTVLFKNLEKHKMIELEDYYRGALRCAKAGRSGEKKIDASLDDIIKNGRPECFFSNEVKWRVEESPADGACSGGGSNAQCIARNKFTDWYE